jgi:LysR family hydrogen peroxide-inducible transcriptional activator
MLSSQQIQYILAMSEHQHFSRAAEACFVTQPTLSMQLKKVEEILGFSIFDRDRSPIVLTKEGQQLLPILLEVASDLQKIENLSKQISGTFREEIKLGIIPTITAYLLPDLYQTWKSAFPSVRIIIVELKTEEILEQLATKKIDLGILAGPMLDVNFRTVPLFTEEIKAFLPDLAENPISLDELRTRQPWLLSKGNCLRTQMIHFCELESTTENNQQWDFEGGNMEMMIRMVELQGGYTLIPAQFGEIIPSMKTHLKTILSENNQKPARSIVAIAPQRTTKWESLEQIIRTIQIKYGTELDAQLQILNWKN